MAQVLICGTLAFDDIGACKAPLDAGTRNVKLDHLHQSFGGCAMNIAYNLAGLGHDSTPFVYAGDDYAGAYARHVAASGISRAGIVTVPGTPCARGIVLTGRDGAQFTAFYPGPTGTARWPTDLEGLLAGRTFDAAILAPDLPGKMAGCAQKLHRTPLRIWCPGQYAEALEPAEIDAVLAHATVLVVNRHEWRALRRHRSQRRLLAAGRRAVITDGPRPVEVLPERVRVPVPEAPPAAWRDPTGCGDA
ncbi:MAG: PfkB family carbohydrate kinase, partial [Pseudomonadota bacterium]